MIEKMAKICEICGKEIIAPNYIFNSSKVLYETFYECAFCNLIFIIEQYNEFKDDFPLTSDFHIRQFNQINKLISSLQ